MPTYNYKCNSCNKIFEEIKPVRLVDVAPSCCGEVKQIILSAPMIDDYFLGSTKNEGYHCVVSDRWVSSKRERKNVMSEFNVQPKV